eukprot:TRINITY_DN17868_c0_g1_i12.p1 TRINITY_DN17868_c0_g1~~TRINITY_DN17868_c0_g1_i12.p1  ORF type:complete len:109 (-),score=32.24 TRINITY_DN17868_c0_g1_i12:200-526(-)
MGYCCRAKLRTTSVVRMCIFCENGETDQSYSLSDAELLEINQCPVLPARVPVTIVSGFLGAGKTTFVNQVLKENITAKYCVVQNEFGSVPVDSALIVTEFAEVHQQCC